MSSLHSIQIGKPQQLGTDGAADPFDRPWTSGIFKVPVTGPVFVGAAGIAGDGQADLAVHGGPDKAVCVYSGDHYADWRTSPELAAMAPGAFGENFTLLGIAEGEACVGDVFRAGDVVLQISQPRQPCWKLARKWRIQDFTLRVVRSGRTGWYFRVLREGWVAAGAVLTLEERPFPDWTVRAANEVMHGRPRDPATAAALASLPPLSASWRATLSKR